MNLENFAGQSNTENQLGNDAGSLLGMGFENEINSLKPPQQLSTTILPEVLEKAANQLEQVRLEPDYLNLAFDNSLSRSNSQGEQTRSSSFRGQQISDVGTQIRDFLFDQVGAENLTDITGGNGTFNNTRQIINLWEEVATQHADNPEAFANILVNKIDDYINSQLGNPDSSGEDGEPDNDSGGDSSPDPSPPTTEDNGETDSGDDLDNEDNTPDSDDDSTPPVEDNGETDSGDDLDNEDDTPDSDDDSTPPVEDNGETDSGDDLDNEDNTPDSD
ncbi:MAG: hypothetical protein WA919_28040, partial [Coleofasciculaceae cyanobacterium]